MAPAYTDIEKPQVSEGYDWFGVHWLPVEATANLTHPDILQEPVFEDISEWEEKLKFPDLETAVDWELAARQKSERAHAAAPPDQIEPAELNYDLFLGANRRPPQLLYRTG